MANEIGNAYIKVMPTAKGIQGSITKELNNEAGNAGDVAGATAGSRLASTMKKVFVMAGVGKMIYSSIGAGADLQQSMGGIETLFKDSADQMFKYANEAYKTAGVSANQYMEQVTSFSAGLISSMGGDVAGATEVANQAMIDMSDNANKMGTDMELIQNAYQGFAKQNYTMLDNLKLGYGGTKTEMERLLKDAQKISGIEYNIENLDDVYNAIHVIQEDLGITGTTAEEASKTISGSINMMKASWVDFLGNLALGNDIQPYLEHLVQSVFTVAKNVIPTVFNILVGLPKALVKLVPVLIDTIKQSGPGILASVIETVNSIWNYLVSQVPVLWEQFKTWIAGIGEMIIEYAPTIVQTVVGLFNQLIGKVGEYLPVILNAVIRFLGSIPGWIWDHMPQILSAVWDIFTNILSALGTFIGTFLNTVWTSLVGTLKTVWDSIKNTASSAFKAIWNAIKAPFLATANFFRSVFSNAWQAIKNVFSGVGSFFGGIWETIKQKFVDIGQKIGDSISGAFKGAVNALLSSAERVLNWPINAINAAIDIINALPGVKISPISPFNLPRLAKGAILTKETMFVGGEAGQEAVVPLDPFWKRLDSMNRGNEITINVYAPDGMDVAELSREIERRIIANTQRREYAWL